MPVAKHYPVPLLRDVYKRQGKHLQFLTQMAVNSPVFKLLFKNYHNHYIQVESLVKQMAKEINEQQQ